MNASSSIWSLVAALVALAMVSCAGTEVGNPVDNDATVEFAAFQETGALILASGLQIDEAWMAFEEVELRDVNTCEEDDIETDNAVVVELISGLELPGEVPLVTPAMRFCRLELDVGREDDMPLPAGSPAELGQYSVLIRGQRADGAPFVVQAEFDDSIELRPSEPDFGLAGTNDPLLVGFAVDAWFVGVDIDNADLQPDGTILLDAENNSDLLEDVTRNIEDSARLVRDSNRNGMVDADELAAIIARGSP